MPSIMIACTGFRTAGLLHRAVQAAIQEAKRTDRKLGSKTCTRASKMPYFELFVTLVYTFFIAKSGRDIVPPA